MPLTMEQIDAARKGAVLSCQAEGAARRHARWSKVDRGLLWADTCSWVLPVEDVLDADWHIEQPATTLPGRGWTKCAACAGQGVRRETPTPYTYTLREGEDRVISDVSPRIDNSLDDSLWAWPERYSCLIFSRLRKDGTEARCESGQTAMFWEGNLERWESTSGDCKYIESEWCLPVAARRRT